jgi:putative nucleotidyltransferase with HDIG domain
VETTTPSLEILRDLSSFWLDGASPTPADLKAAASVAAKMAELEGIKPFPAVVQRLVDYVSQPDFKLDLVRQLIESDPSLAIRIMRVANSAAYRTFDSCATVTKAVIRIGAVGVVELAMGMSAMTLFKDIGGVGRAIRDHSAGTAAVAREIASRVDQSAVSLSSKVYLAGLLHDIGKLLMLQTGDIDYAELAASATEPHTLHPIEQARLGFDHAMLGGHMLRAWKLPHPIPLIVIGHHQEKAHFGKSGFISQAIDIVRVADRAEWLVEQGVNANSPLVERVVRSPEGIRLGLPALDIKDLWNELQLVREEALSVFR